MRKTNIVIACVCLFTIAVMPAQAFTAKSLTMTLTPDGDAEIDMHYDLSQFFSGLRIQLQNSRKHSMKIQTSR